MKIPRLYGRRLGADVGDKSSGEREERQVKMKNILLRLSKRYLSEGRKIWNDEECVGCWWWNEFHCIVARLDRREKRVQIEWSDAYVNLNIAISEVVCGDRLRKWSLWRRNRGCWCVARPRQYLKQNSLLVKGWIEVIEQSCEFYSNDRLP